MSKKRVRIIILLLLICSCNIYSQRNKDNIITGKYEGKVFEIVDSTECCIILRPNIGHITEDNKMLNFYINIPKGMIFKKSITSFNNLYMFDNEDKETIVIEVFRDKNTDKQSSREHLSPKVQSDTIGEIRCYGFFIHDEYVIYYYNVRPYNNTIFFECIRSIRRYI